MSAERLEVLGVMGISDVGRMLVQAQNKAEAKERTGITVSETEPQNPELYDVWVDIS